MTGYRWRRKGTPSVLDKVVSVTWRGGGKWSPSRRLASSSIDYTNSSPRHSSKRPIRDTLTFSRENETFHSAACTPFPPSFDRSIPLADIGSRATLPLLDKFAFQLVIAQHDSLLRTHTLCDRHPLLSACHRANFTSGGHSVFRGEWLYEWKWRDGLGSFVHVFWI